jgi:hypothetical protein
MTFLDYGETMSEQQMYVATRRTGSADLALLEKDQKSTRRLLQPLKKEMC